MTDAGAIRRLRHSARALILDEHDAVLLCRFQLPHPAVPNDAIAVWAAPGGGLEQGESALQALRRELLEATGLRLDSDPPHVWRQEAVAPGLGADVDGVRNDYFLVRTTRFSPRGQLSAAEIAAENISEMRWWTLAEIAGYSGTDLFSPRDLVTPLGRLLDGDVPAAPIALGL